MNALFQYKPHFVAGAKHHLALDAQPTPPVPCDFELGDKVIFTNAAGVVFTEFMVTGFSPTLDGRGRFLYLNWDCWWFPASPQSLQHHPQSNTVG